MYYRLMNAVDGEMFEKYAKTVQLDSGVVDRINEILRTLDDTYCTHRTSYAMGGYVLVFTTREDFNASIEKLRVFYSLSETGYEYRDNIGNDNSWIEELYQIDSDESLVLIYKERMRG